MLVAAVCALVVLLALALLAVPLLRLWRQTTALARTVADAGDRLAAVTAGLDGAGPEAGAGGIGSEPSPARHGARTPGPGARNLPGT